MLHVLFVSITGKRRDDEAAMTKLAACADIFDPSNNALGRGARSVEARSDASGDAGAGDQTTAGEQDLRAERRRIARSARQSRDGMRAA